MYNRLIFLSGSLLITTLSVSSSFPSSEPAKLEIVVEGLKRVSANEVHLVVKVTNKTELPIFLAGINYDFLRALPHSADEHRPNPSPELVFIEQRRSSEGWKTLGCVENPPPDVIKLNPVQTITHVIWWKLPEIGICKNRITNWEGEFRFRLEYFESEKQARTYIDKLFSPHWKEARAEIAVSEPFEIPPPPNP